MEKGDRKAITETERRPPPHVLLPERRLVNFARRNQSCFSAILDSQS